MCFELELELGLGQKQGERVVSIGRFGSRSRHRSFN